MLLGNQLSGKWIVVPDFLHTVIIVAGDIEVFEEKNQNQLEEAINRMKNSSENLLKILELQEIKEYLQEIDQLKNLNEKVLKTNNSNVINLKLDMFSLVNLKTEMLSFIEKLNNIDLESIFSNKISLSISEIDKYLPRWKNYCIKIANYFENLSNLNNNMKDNLFFFEIQEKLLTKIEKVKTELHDQFQEVEKYKSKKNIFKPYQKEIDEKNEKIYSKFLLTIGLKLVYDLIAELGYVAKRLKLLDQYSIQNISDFWKKLIYELELTEGAVEVFKESEQYIKECCLDYIVKNLINIGCLVNNFCKQIIVERIVEI
ncbi:9420_t:CDS:2 [Cetraspora pellucida]|uniref:9420_t:CDS:1 n=1 Tax=Cetraspora pellucida TaxID=1433469 RepID=A0A9N9BE08_9GLOM|nr:9420_t:CDS:2 [Cetraspora pellucida]